MLDVINLNRNYNKVYPYHNYGYSSLVLLTEVHCNWQNETLKKSGAVSKVRTLRKADPDLKACESFVRQTHDLMTLTFRYNRDIRTK